MKTAVVVLFALGAVGFAGSAEAQTDSSLSYRHELSKDRELEQYRPWHSSLFVMANAALPSGFSLEAGWHISDIAGIGFTAGIRDGWSNDPSAVKIGLAAEIYVPLRSFITPYIHGAIGAGGPLFSSDSYGIVSAGALIRSGGSTSTWLQFRAEAGAFFASRNISGGLLSPTVTDNKTYLYIMFGVEINS